MFKERIGMIPFVILAIENDSDRDFMTDLYLKYARLMYAEARKIVKNQCDPDDVVNTALIKLIEKLPTLRALEERQRVNYLITTVKHTALTEVCKLTKTTIESIDDESWYDRISSGESVEECVERRESAGLLQQVWRMLDAKSRYLLQARYFLSMEDGEIASEIGVKPNSVRMELTRARRKARALLEAQGIKDPWM